MCLIDAMTICVLHEDGLIKTMAMNTTDMSRDIKTTRTLRLEGVMDDYHGVVRFNDSLVVSGIRQDTMYWCVVSLDDGHVDTIHQICEGYELSSISSRVTTKDKIIYVACDAGFDGEFRHNTGVYGFDILNPSQCKYTFKHKRLQRPTSIVINEDGNIFVCNSGFFDPCIHQLTASCQLVAIFTQGILWGLEAIFWDNGRLYATCYKSRDLGKSDITVFQHVHQVGSHTDSEEQRNVEKGQSSVETEMPSSVPYPGDSEDKQGSHQASEVQVSNERRHPVIEETVILIGQENEQLNRRKEDYTDAEKHEGDRRHILDTPRNREKSPESQVHGESMISEACNRFSIINEQKIFFPKNPRNCQIVTMNVNEMKGYIDNNKNIGGGAFGTVFKAKMPKEETCKFVIKQIQVTAECFKKSYDREIHNGRILHPFINPVIARAESDETMSGSICYIMYPYMKNRDLRHNINRVNGGEKLSAKDTNSRIWIRCIHQMVQAVDFLHMSIPLVRDPIFHRDLTSRNILLDTNYNVRIGDFGIAVEAKGNKTHATQTRIMGTEGYHPPNMDRNNYHASYDVFSLGIVVLEILTGLEAKLNTEPHYIYRKYNLKNDRYLKTDLEDRAATVKNEAAVWANETFRDTFADFALRAVDLDESQQNKTCLLQTLPDKMRLIEVERYQKPKNLERCVSCCVNPIAKLSTKGRSCIQNQCQYFCIHCLMNHHLNPLVCPLHGKTRPPFGDHVYGVFVAGNDVPDAQHLTGIQGKHRGKTVAETFKGDVEKVRQILISRHPFVLGVSESNLKLVAPKEPGTKDKMELYIKKAFTEINDTIKQAMKEKKLNPEEDRLPNSLFLFYFSGHCSKDKGLQLGDTDENLKASTTWIQKMLHKELAVDQIGIVLDCCHADSQNFTATQGLSAEESKNKNKKVSIVQLSSCDEYEKSSATPEGHGSKFTNLFCQGLLGLNTMEDDKVKFCEECEKRRTPQTDSTLPCGRFHNYCQSDNCVSFYTMKNFIKGHFDLQKADGSNPQTMTTVFNAQGEKEVFLAYYNPYKLHIPIHLKGCDASQSFHIRSRPVSMDILRQDIMNHKVKIGWSDVLNQDPSCVLNSSRLIAICPKFGRDKDCELTTLDSIYKARSCGRDLEARVRENISGISNGPVKLNNINATMVTSSGASIDDDHLTIDQSCIQIPIKTINMAEKQMRVMQQAAANSPYKTLISEVMKTIRTIHELSLIEGREEHVLKFSLNTNFSILTIE